MLFISSVSTGLTIDTDIGEELRTSLVEEYANQKKPTDGEIYHKIQQYEGKDNEAFQERWFVRLSSSNQDHLDQLDNKRNCCLQQAFDQLLAPGKSQINAKTACGLTLSGQAFAEFSDKE